MELEERKKKIEEREGVKIGDKNRVMRADKELQRESLEKKGQRE